MNKLLATAAVAATLACAASSQAEASYFCRFNAGSFATTAWFELATCNDDGSVSYWCMENDTSTYPRFAVDAGHAHTSYEARLYNFGYADITGYGPWEGMYWCIDFIEWPR